MVKELQQKIRKGNGELFEKWFRFLGIAQFTPKNKELITNYFFERCASAPEKFYKFIIFFNEKLQSEKDPQKQKVMALKYLDILSHLCERFGFFEVKKQLDDTCFKITNPKEYEKIDQFLADYKKKSKKITQDILKVLEKLLKKNEYKCKIQGRYKTIYSIYKKSRKKRRAVFELNDIFAFRIINQRNSVEECFEILNLLHDKFHPITEFFKDYVSVPKINGYQSIQTGLTKIIPELDLPVEIQIRTKAMDDFAEKGLAAHWIYSEEKRSKIITEKEKKLVNYLTSFANTGPEEPKIYCFSYDGNVFMMPKGSTLLDFAYHIHTSIGNAAKGAKINGKEKPLYCKIKEGDMIEIMKSQRVEARPKWLKFAHNKYTQKKIKISLKKYANQD